MDNVVESIRVVKGPMGLRSQQQPAGLPGWLSRAAAVGPCAAPAGTGPGPPGAAPG